MRLYVLQMGISPASGSPVPAYLIQTDDGTNVLVDSGFPREMIGQEGGSFAVEEDDFVVNRLAAIGVQPDDVRYVVCTHLDPDQTCGDKHYGKRSAEISVGNPFLCAWMQQCHDPCAIERRSRSTGWAADRRESGPMGDPRDRKNGGGPTKILISTYLDPDHAGGHDNFPNAEFVIQRVQYEAAISGEHQRFERMRAHWDVPGLRYRTVDGDTELLPGVELIETGGHAPGHQSVLVRLPQTGPVVLAIDAIPRQFGDFTPENRPVGPFDADEAGTRVSTRKLVDLVAREGAALMIHGHDPAQWTTLKRSPQYYS